MNLAFLLLDKKIKSFNLMKNGKKETKTLISKNLLVL